MRSSLSRDVVLPVAHVLKELGAPLTGLERLPAAVDSAIADDLMQQAADAIGEDVGVRAAKRMPLGALGPVDYALSTAATVADGLERLARFYGVATDRIELKVLSGEHEGIELVRRPGAAHSRHWIEFSLMLILGRVRAAVGGPVEALEVSFAHPAPSSRTEHASLFGASVVFDAIADRLIFEPNTLARPFKTSSPFLGGVLEKKLDEIETSAHGDALLRRVREAVAQMLGVERLDIESVARRLAMSQRSLQRHLRDRHTSFKSIVDDIRRERAIELVDAGTPAATIATRLGFADASAFFRAHRRWTGKSPGTRRDDE